MEIIKNVFDYLIYYWPLLVLIGFGLFFIFFVGAEEDRPKSVAISHRLKKN